MADNDQDFDVVVENAEGLRYRVGMHSEAAFQEWKREVIDEPESNLKIVGDHLTDAESLALCEQTNTQVALMSAAESRVIEQYKKTLEDEFLSPEEIERLVDLFRGKIKEQTTES